MSEPTKQQIAEALRESGPIILAAGPREVSAGTAPRPDETWHLPGGTAWVFLADKSAGLTRPVILADGFNSGPSTLEYSWTALELSGYRMISELRRRGRDAILLGFHERSASILHNAQTAQTAILRAIHQRRGDAPLAVGGFSMGGLVTRYALAELEHLGTDHQTELYWSYDSPHRGAWIPIALQAFAHYSQDLDATFSNQINSPAAQQLLWRHIGEWNAVAEESKLRKDFRTALREVGGWPRGPRLIGVANGVGTGAGTGLQPGAVAVEGTGISIKPTKLYIQSSGQATVADLLLLALPPLKDHVRTDGLPTIDGAPGGTLEGFGILADALNAVKVIGIPVVAATAHIRSHCFVPAVSAVAIRDPDTDDNLYTNIDEIPAAQSELNEFKCASHNEEHSKVTEELCTWIFDRLP